MDGAKLVALALKACNHCSASYDHDEIVEQPHAFGDKLVTFTCRCGKKLTADAELVKAGIMVTEAEYRALHPSGTRHLSRPRYIAAEGIGSALKRAIRKLLW